MPFHFFPFLNIRTYHRENRYVMGIVLEGERMLDRFGMERRKVGTLMRGILVPREEQEEKQCHVGWIVER